jgi:hypothetical protein
MSLISQYIEAQNDAIRTGNLEADPVHKEFYRLWQEAKQAKEQLVRDLASQIRAQGNDTKQRNMLKVELDREVARIGQDCQVLVL